MIRSTWGRILRFFQKPYRWAWVFGAALSLSFALVLLDAFVIPRALRQTVPTPGAAADGAGGAGNAALAAPDEPAITTTTYQDANIQIEIETLRRNDTNVYIADIRVADASLLKTALARGVFGRNITETTSQMAEDNGAIFAINGDFYGFRDDGYVLRNGVLYRDAGGGNELLVVDQKGDFSVAAESDTDAATLLAEGAWQVFSFGPALINDGEIIVAQGEEINGRAMNSNPRTAIGQAGPLHYVVIVSDGRTKESAGLSLYDLAGEFAARGCTVAYNLDGGGSSSMVFNGEVVNHPVDMGKRSSGGERKVSDIVYIGYQ